MNTQTLRDKHLSLLLLKATWNKTRANHAEHRNNLERLRADPRALSGIGQINIDALPAAEAHLVELQDTVLRAALRYNTAQNDYIELGNKLLCDGGDG